MTLLRLRGVAVARGQRLLAKGIDAEVGPGAALWIEGPNGAGKSSLLRVAAGLLAPAAGVVRRDAGQGWLGEGHSLDGERPLAQALAFWLRIDGIADPHTRVRAAMAELALSPLASVPVRLLSSGQRRRAAIARIVAAAPPLWLLDEPANALDAASVGLLEGVIERHRANGGGVVVASHQGIALPGADRLRLGAE